jgi:DNA-binding XRE family transcriptional regulator
MDGQMKINSEVIRSLREQKAWSQEHLAVAAGLSARTVQRVEAEGVGSSETRLALAAALGVPISTLLSTHASSASNPQYRGEMPRGAWIGLGVGVMCSMGAIGVQYALGVATLPETARNLGIVFAIFGFSLGAMGAIRGSARLSRQ